MTAGIDPLTYLNRVLGPDRLLDLKPKVPIIKIMEDLIATTCGHGSTQGGSQHRCQSAGWDNRCPRGGAWHCGASQFSELHSHRSEGSVTDGKVQVEQADVAIDCGLAAIDRVQSQMEGLLFWPILGNDGWGDHESRPGQWQFS